MARDDDVATPLPGVIVTFESFPLPYRLRNAGGKMHIIRPRPVKWLMFDSFIQLAVNNSRLIFDNKSPIYEWK